MNAPLIALLRLVHILSGIFWLGSTLTLGGFLLPAMRSAPSAGVLWRAIMQRHRLQLWMNISMALAILAGFALYGIDSATSSGAFNRSAMGKVLGLGAILAIAAAGVMGAMTQRAGRQLADLAEGNRATATPSGGGSVEADALQARLSRGLAITNVLLLLSATTMAIARYL
jgi:uncharacterized membrane protein